ncbi:hypothetical protein, partial [Parabacteroides goldsteinii]|uniref:hypothetical protein n=1 Tax=Parabacteroides goldsteinii TaxID=328812 RepID=UPI002574BD39
MQRFQQPELQSCSGGHCLVFGHAGTYRIGSGKLSAAGARWSMTAGFLGFIISKCLVGFGVAPFNSIFINFLDPFFIGLYLSLIFAVIGSKVSPVTPEESAYRDSLLALPQE